MPELSWQELYLAALLESDPIQTPERIETARKAIHARLTQREELLSQRERDQIEDALRALVRRRIALGAKKSPVPEPGSGQNAPPGRQERDS